MISNVRLGKNVRIPQPKLVNLYGCKIGEGSLISSFVEIGKGVKLGKYVKVEAFAYIPEGVIIGDEVFIGPHVCFTNDKHPRAVNPKWKVLETYVGKKASIGANATIICGVTIGEGAVIGAGSVVTKDVRPWTTVVGNPARVFKAPKTKSK